MPFVQTVRLEYFIVVSGNCKSLWVHMTEKSFQSGVFPLPWFFSTFLEVPKAGWMGLGATWSSGRSHWLELDDILGPTLPKPLCADFQYISSLVYLVSLFFSKQRSCPLSPFWASSYSLCLYQLPIPGSQEEMLSCSWVTSSGVLEIFVSQTSGVSMLQYVKKRIAPAAFPSCLWTIPGGGGVEVSRMLGECSNSSKSAEALFLPTFKKSSASPRRFMWNRKSIVPTAYSQDIVWISCNNLFVVTKHSQEIFCFRS